MDPTDRAYEANKRQNAELKIANGCPVRGRDCAKPTLHFS